MPKAHEIATELRKFADSLDTNPDAELRQPRLSFYYTHFRNPKEPFLATARLMPRPIKKGDGFDHAEVTLEYNNGILGIYTAIAKSEMCRLLTPARPAVYECEPILSQSEEEALIEA